MHKHGGEATQKFQVTRGVAKPSAKGAKKNAFPELPFMETIVSSSSFESGLIKACKALVLEKVAKAKLGFSEQEVSKYTENLIREMLTRKDVPVLEDDYIDLKNPKHVVFVEDSLIHNIINGGGKLSTKKRSFGGSPMRALTIFILAALFNVLFLLGLFMAYVAINDAYIRYCEDVVNPRHVWASLTRLFKPAPSPMMRMFCQYASHQHQKVTGFMNQAAVENNGLTVLTFMLATGLLRMTAQPEVRNFIQGVLNNVSPFVGAGMMPMLNTLLMIMGSTWSASDSLARNLVNYVTRQREATQENATGWRDVATVARAVFLEDQEVVNTLSRDTPRRSARVQQPSPPRAAASNSRSRSRTTRSRTTRS